MSTITIAGKLVDTSKTPILIAGPCVLEREEDALRVAKEVKALAEKRGFFYLFKSSYLKDNRSSIHSYTGPGMEEGLKSLRAVREQVGVPVLTDIHSAGEAEPVAQVCDVLQIPAFLSRQTSLIVAASRTGKALNIKKGQFLAPQDMRNVVEKARASGAEDVMITERGTSFGYHNLVVDFAGFPVMREIGVPLILDVTHSLQLPGALGDKSGGRPAFARFLARAGVAAGCDGLFIETHFAPLTCQCDAEAMLPLGELPRLLDETSKLFEVIREFDTPS